MTTTSITAGPSQWDIILSLHEEKPVTFTLDNGTKVSCVISAVMDHKYWDYLDNQELSAPIFLLTGEYEDEQTNVVYACYSTTNRAGLMTIVQDRRGDHKSLRHEWALRITGYPPRELVWVRDMHAKCSFHMRPDAIAASDNCNNPAVSMVVDRDRYRLYRCVSHEGQIDNDQQGEVMTRILRVIE